MKYPIHPDFNDRKIGTCDRCGASGMLYPNIKKNLCLDCWKVLFRQGGLVPFLESEEKPGS